MAIMEEADDNPWTGKGGYSRLNKNMKWDLNMLAEQGYHEMQIQEKIDFIVTDGKPDPIPFCVRMAFIEGFLNGTKSASEEMEKNGKRINRITLYLN